MNFIKKICNWFISDEVLTVISIVCGLLSLILKDYVTFGMCLLMFLYIIIKRLYNAKK